MSEWWLKMAGYFPQALCGYGWVNTLSSLPTYQSPQGSNVNEYIML